MSDEPSYRYRVVGHAPVVDADFILEDFAYDIYDAQKKAASHRRWGWTAWIERQLIVQEPRWDRLR